MKTVVVVVLFAALCSPAQAFQLDPAEKARVDQVFDEFNRTTGPGCAVGVVQNGRLVFERGYGMGSLDHGIPLTGASVFYLASVSKQFAAAAVLIAAHEGYLSLDDDLRQHIPEFPDYGTPVTVRNLLHHTGGVRDYLTLMFLAGTPLENILSDEEMLGLIVRQRELNFVPGSEFLYSNSGYVLLAEIVHRATGRSLREYADEKIFDPLGMTDTHFHDDRTHVVQRRVFSYEQTDGGEWATNYLINFDKVGDGGLYSTVADLAAWDRAFYDDILGVPSFADAMYERGVLTSGDTIVYARGLGVGDRRGLRRIAHGGGLMAFRTMIARYPDHQTTVVTLCNDGSANPGALSTAVEDIVLEGAFPEAPQESEASSAEDEETAATTPVDLTVLRRLEGQYASEELGAVWYLEAGNAGLVLNHLSGGQIVLSPESDDVYSGSGLVLSFASEGGEVSTFSLQAGRVQNLRFERVP